MGIYAELHSLVDQFRNQNRDTNKRIKALEKRVPDYSKQGHDVEEFYPPNTPEKVDVPTDKDEPKFKVGDTIAYLNGTIRIVLGINPDTTLALMEVPSGHKQKIPANPGNYTLVYRPELPKEA